MKTEKTIVPQLQSHPVPDEVMCKNMRVIVGDTGERCMVPVGSVREVIDGDVTPLCLHRRHDGSAWLFIADGNQVEVVPVDADTMPIGGISHIMSLEAEPTAAVSLDADTVLVFTASSCHYADLDESGWAERADLEEFPPVSIRAVDTHRFSSVVAARTLTGGYVRWAGHLDANDTRDVTADLVNAYDGISSSAASADYFIQPVIARYRLLDRHGTTIFLSSPVIVAPDGAQCVNQLTANVNVADGVFKNLTSYSIDATGYKLAVCVSRALADNWRNVIDRLVVEVSPQFEPINRSATAFSRMENATSSTGTLRLMMPGADSAQLRIRDMVGKSMPVLDELLKPVYVVMSPFDASTTTPLVDIDIPIVPSVKITAVSTVSKSVKTLPRETLLLSKSTRFGAEVVAPMGSDLVMASLTAWRSAPCSPFSFVTSASGFESAWRAYIRVSLSDGNVSVNSFTMYGDTPIAISPLLSYPSADAVEMEFAVKGSDGVVRRAVFPLVPVNGADMALYVADTLSPLQLPISATPYIVPSETRLPCRMPSTIAVAKLFSPSVVTASESITAGRIVAVTPSRRTSSSWDFARMHLYAFSTSGIYTVAVRAARDAVSATCIDSRTVASAMAVAIHESGVYAIAGSDLVNVSSSSVTTVEGNVTSEMIGYDSHFSELWLSGSGGVDIMSKAGFYRRSCVVSGFHNVGGFLFTSDGDRLAIAGKECPGLIDVEWKRRLLRDDVLVEPFPPRRRPAPVYSVTWRVSADLVDALFSLSGDNGSRLPDEMLSLAATGAIDYPIVARTNIPFRLYLTVGFAGSVDSSFRFHSFTTVTK